jgi:ubiquinone/menaquinone biosynthesis C-methylase UbiE
MKAAAPVLTASVAQRDADGMNSATLPRLNLGCGPNAPDGWLNVDGSWNAWFSHHRHLRKALVTVGLIPPNFGADWKVRPIVHDLTKPLPFAANSISAVYASHVLEHLYLVDAQRLLEDCKRVLRPGGTIRLVVPDLRAMAVSYLSKKNGGSSTSENAGAADYLNARLAFRNPSPPAGNPVFRLYSLWKDFHSHKWMYDADSLAHYLQLAGFQGVGEKEFLRSDIPGIQEVEEEDRVLAGAGVCVEGRKPENQR